MGPGIELLELDHAYQGELSEQVHLHAVPVLAGERVLGLLLKTLLSLGKPLIFANSHI